MNIEAKLLREALSRALKVIKGRAMLPILSCVMLEASKGTLTIMATDLDCYLRLFVPCKGDLAPVCVPAFRLAAILNCETVALTMDGTRLKVSSENYSSALPTLPADEMPPLPKVGKAIGVSIPDLADSIEAVAWACDFKQEARPLVGGVWIKGEPKRLRAATCQGALACISEKHLICSEFEAITDGRFALMLCAVLRETGATFYLSDNVSWVKSSESEIACKLIEGKYFNMDLLLKEERVELGEWVIKDFSLPLDVAISLSSDGSFPSVRLEPAKDGMEVILEKQEADYRHSLPFKMGKSPIRFSAPLLRNAITHAGERCQVSVAGTMVFMSSGDLTTIIATLEKKAKP